MLELELRPGHSLGPFVLGTSLWNVLDLLREENTRYPHVDIKYDTQQPATTPIILHLRPHGIDLLFSPLAQRLTTISLRLARSRSSAISGSLSPASESASSLATPFLTYRGSEVVLSSPDVVLRRASVNKVFGPTYAGDTLYFPGVWFAFDEDGSGPNSSLERDRHAEVKRVVVCQRSASDEATGAMPPKPPRDGLSEVIEYPSMDGELRTAIVHPHKGVTLLFYDSTASGRSSPSLEDVPPNTAPPIHVRIGETSSEDLICDLGSPLRVFYKEDERMAIHSYPSDRANGDEPDQGYFYNYFQHGIDFLISGSTHRVKKIILHSNIPGSFHFQRYKRCPWEIQLSNHVVSINDRIDQIQPYLQSGTPSMLEASSKRRPKGSETAIRSDPRLQPPSMVLDRGADAQQTNDKEGEAPVTLPGGALTKLLGFEGMVLEVSDIGDVLTVMLF